MESPRVTSSRNNLSEISGPPRVDLEAMDRTPPNETRTDWNVRCRKEGDKLTYKDVFTRRFVKIETFIERFGFNPNTGKVFDPRLVPAEFRDQFGLSGDAASQRASPNDETIVSSEILREPSLTGTASNQQSPADNVSPEQPPDADKDTGSRTKDGSRTLEASATSTPRSDAERLQRDSEDRNRRAKELGEDLDSLDEWKQWAKGQYALFAGTELPLPHIVTVQTRNAGIWKKLDCISANEAQELNLLRKRIHSLQNRIKVYSDSGIYGAAQLRPVNKTTIKLRLTTLRSVADEMSEAYSRAVVLLENLLRRIKRDKQPPVEPTLVKELLVILRELSHAVKVEFRELNQAWKDHTDFPRDANALGGVSAQLDKVYLRDRATLHAKYMRFMRHLHEEAIPFLQHYCQRRMGFAVAESFSGVEIGSSLSEPEMDSASSWAEIKESYMEDPYLPASGARGPSSAGKRLSARKVPKPSAQGRIFMMRATELPSRKQTTSGRGPTDTYSEPRDRHEAHGARRRDEGDETLTKEDLSYNLRRKEDELDRIRRRLDKGIDSHGYILARSARRAMKDRKGEVKEEILDLKNELEWIRRKEKRQQEESYSSRRYPSPSSHSGAKPKTGNRRVTLDLPRKSIRAQEHFVSSEDTDSEREQPQGLYPGDHSRRSTRNQYMFDIYERERPQGSLLRDRNENAWDDDEDQQPRGTLRTPGKWPNVLDMSMNFGAESRMLNTASGGYGDPYDDLDDDPRRHRRSHGQRDHDDRRDRDRRDQRDHRDRQERDGRRDQGRKERADREEYVPDRDDRHYGRERGHGRRPGGDSDGSDSSDHGRRRGGGGDRDRDQGNRRPGRDLNRRDGDDHRRPGRRDRGGGGSPPSSSDPSSDGEDTDTESSDSRDRRGRRRNNMRLNPRDFLKALKGEKDKDDAVDRTAQRELLEGFTDAEEMRDYYLNLPKPWNVLPRKTGKKQDILKYISMMITTPKQFKGNRDDGSYLDWRMMVIEAIHRQPLSIMDKIHLLGTSVKTEGKETLRQIFNAGTHTPEAYKRILESLESQYGGDARAYSYLRDQMINMPGFDLKNLNSVTLIRTKVEKFMEYVKLHQLRHFARSDNKTLLELVLSNVLSKSQVLQFRKTCTSLNIGGGNLHNLRSLADWLKYEEQLLQWADQNHNPNLMGAKKGNKISANKITTGGSSDDESVSPNMAALLAKQNQNLDTRSEIASRFDWAEEVSDQDIDDDKVVDDESLDTEPDDGDGGGAQVDGAPSSDLAMAVVDTKPATCGYCKKARHLVSKCEEFRQLPVSARYDFCKKDNRCGNCLSPRHNTRKCPSTYRCQECGKKHHTLLHYKGAPGQPPAKAGQPAKKSS